MNWEEITGQPCAGKSSFLANYAKDNQSSIFKNHKGLARKVFYFFLGIYFLGFQKLKVLFCWSSQEDGPYYFRLNIFINAVSRFGIFCFVSRSISEKRIRFLIDEGISHLPFLFLKTDTSLVINFISNDLKTVNVLYLRSPEFKVIQNRLLSRGHLRLKFLLASAFIQRVQEIENVMLSQYPKLCNKFKVLENVTSI